MKSLFNNSIPNFFLEGVWVWILPAAFELLVFFRDVAVRQAVP